MISMYMHTLNYEIRRKWWKSDGFVRNQVNDDEWKSQQLIKQYDDDVHNINWLSLPSNDL
jgi:hypothetical protein